MIWSSNSRINALHRRHSFLARSTSTSWLYSAHAHQTGLGCVLDTASAAKPLFMLSLTDADKRFRAHLHLRVAFPAVARHRRFAVRRVHGRREDGAGCRSFAHSGRGVGHRYAARDAGPDRADVPQLVHPIGGCAIVISRSLDPLVGHYLTNIGYAAFVSTQDPDAGSASGSGNFSQERLVRSS